MQIPSSKKKFVLYSEPRTGSSLLSLWLNNHPEIRSHAEVFLRAQPGQDKFDYFCRKSLGRKLLYRLFLNRFTANQAPEIQRRLIRPYLDQLFNSPEFSYPYKEGQDKTKFYPNPNFENEKIVGFKLMRVQMEFYSVLKEWLEQDNLHVLYLYRENPLHQLISWYQLRQSKQAHSSKGYQAPPVEVNHHELIADLWEHRVHHESNLKRIQHQSHLLLTYESLTGEPEKTAKKIGDWLGVDFESTPLPTLKKVGRKDWTEAVTNAEEVKRVLRKSEFAQYL